MRGRRRASSPRAKSLEKPLKGDAIPESIHRMHLDSGLSLADYIQQILLSNPFVPPKGDRCPINDLPNELLAHIFWLGTFGDDEEDDEDDEFQLGDEDLAALQNNSDGNEIM